MSKKDLQVLGWREWLSLPDLGIRRIKAKVDTGARSSCLHALQIEEFRRARRDWVSFVIEVEPSRLEQRVAPVVDRREVRDSGGHRTVRPFIRTQVCLANNCWPIELNLAARGDMLFSMLLGRTAMLGRYMVNPKLSYTKGGSPEEVVCD